MASDILADVLARAGRSLKRNLEMNMANGKGAKLVSAGIDDKGHASVMVDAPMRKGMPRHKTTQSELYDALFVSVHMLRELMKRTDRREMKPEMDALEAVVAEKDMRRHHTLLNARMREIQTEGLE